MSPARSRSADDEPLVGIEPGALREMRLRDMALRFGFGAVISVTAGIVGLVWGPRAGGMFLAFPAILPATLTLIEKKEGTPPATEDDRGAVLGALGLVAFAVSGYVAFHYVDAPLTLALATAAWALASVALYLAVEAARRR